MQQHPAELAAAWFAQACDDADSAAALSDTDHFATCCFLCHQAADKALKAILFFRSGDRPRTHVIATLITEIAEQDPELAARFHEATALDPFYVSTRYPNAIGGAVPAASFHRREAETALMRARSVLDIVRDRLPQPRSL